ncbi:MAG: phosphoribosylformylglycinamidine synthase subunit PurL [bacterium]
MAQGLTAEEYEQVRAILGREPNLTELAIFAVMWSEHCSYKNSIRELKKLPRSGGRLLASAGEENAGLVDIGEGWAVAFKIESHNHPSAVDPFQGAATGVGGILRDIFTMGARPLVVLDSLRFGDLSDSRSRYLLDGVVRGIGFYGNCFGVPTAGGEIAFHPAYRDNPLVNVLAVGVVRVEGVVRASAKGVGNPVYYIGSRTGRDGIHGATFASEELSGENEDKRPAVQVGDPFAEKLLLEATLELAASGAVVALQDMGAAGLTCSSTEMSARGDVGMEIDLDRVPLREADMEAWEIMLSESQERMLMVVQKGREEEVTRILTKWDLQAVPIGQVTAERLLRVWWRGKVVAEVPPCPLVLGCGAPQYEREFRPPEELLARQQLDLTALNHPEDRLEALFRLLSHPDVASKRWVFRQYDVSVRTNTVVEPGRGDAVVIRVEGTDKGLAIKTDGNGRKVLLDPFVGTAQAVVESARNVACVGARPIAITNCLNFGHPYKPEVYYYFRQAVAGMGEACRELGTPVTGGNVSFYNETDGKPVLPTPVIGMLGVLEEVSHHLTSAFRSDGDLIVLLGEPSGEGLGGSLYLWEMFGLIGGRLDPPRYHQERALYQLLEESARQGLLHSAHDVSDGGLAVALAECCIGEGEPQVLEGRVAWVNLRGCRIRWGEANPDVAQLFGEPSGWVLVSLPQENGARFFPLAQALGVPYRVIGEVGGDEFVWEGWWSVPVRELADRYFSALPRLMGEPFPTP